MPVRAFEIFGVVDVDIANFEKKIGLVEDRLHGVVDEFNQSSKSSDQYKGKLDQAGRSSQDFEGKTTKAGKATRGFKGELDQAGRSTQKVSSELRSLNSQSLGGVVGHVRSLKSALSDVGGGGGLLGGVLSVAGGNLLTSAISKVAGGFTGVIKSGIEFNDLLERANIGFTTMTGSAEKAKKHLAELVEFGTKTPFKTADLIEYSQQLQAFGFRAEEVVPTLTAVGDAVSALGGGADKIGRVVLALGQMKTKGKVSGEEIRQLAEAGIPAWEFLAKAAGVSVARVQKLAEQGRLDASKAVEVLVAGMESRFPGMMKKVEGTYSAMWSTIEDLTQQRSATAFEPMFQAIKEGQKLAITGLDSAAAIGFAQSAAKLQGLLVGPLRSVVTALATGDASGIGSAIVEGIGTGIKDSAGAAVGAAKDLGNRIADGTREVLGINSPSRVFFEMGEMCGLGFSLGFDMSFQQETTKILTRVGDTLRKIAERYNVPLEKMQQLFPRHGIDDELDPGQQVPIYRIKDTPVLRRRSRARGSSANFSPEIERLIEENARRTNIDANLIRAMMHQESGGKVGAVSHKGARGLMQLMPATAARFGVQNIFNPAQNIRGGTDYMRYLLDMFNGDVRLALAGYNAGEGAVKKYGNKIPPYKETQNYVRSIMARYQGGQAQPSFGLPNSMPFLTIEAGTGRQVNYFERDNEETLRKRMEAFRKPLGDKSQSTEDMLIFSDFASKARRNGEPLPHRMNAEQLQRLQDEYVRAMDGELKRRALATLQKDIYGGAGYPSILGNSTSAAPSNLPELPLPQLGNFADSIPKIDVDKLFPPVIDETLIKLVLDFKQLNDEAPKLAGGLDDAGKSAATFGNLVTDADGRVKGLVISGGSLRERLKEIEDGIPPLKQQMEDFVASLPEGMGDVFAGAVQQWDGTFKGFFQSTLQGFSQMLRSMAAELIRSQVTQLLARLLGGIFNTKSGAGSIVEALDKQFENVPLDPNWGSSTTASNMAGGNKNGSLPPPNDLSKVVVNTGEDTKDAVTDGTGGTTASVKQTGEKTHGLLDGIKGYGQQTVEVLNQIAAGAGQQPPAWVTWAKIGLEIGGMVAGHLLGGKGGDSGGGGGGGDGGSGGGTSGGFGRFSTGGFVSGDGTSTSDSIAARLSNGEFVIRAAAVQKFGKGFFDQLNSLSMPAQFASGGYTGRAQMQSLTYAPQARGGDTFNISIPMTIHGSADERSMRQSVKQAAAEFFAMGAREHGRLR